ncbi:MAG: hypothetical protein E3J56_01095 [Candidatus Aminicenantes bacterium]|nr:MAG: hypothetical protein E3J56_01095 [Candidatus Aminicenantes bacterium]
MKCKYCSCTDDKPCTGGCAWAFKNVCTSCVLVPHNTRKAIEAFLSDPEVESVELFIKRKKEKRKEGFLIISK